MGKRKFRVLTRAAHLLNRIINFASFRILSEILKTLVGLLRKESFSLL